MVGDASGGSVSQLAGVSGRPSSPWPPPFSSSRGADEAETFLRCRPITSSMGATQPFAFRVVVVPFPASVGPGGPKEGSASVGHSMHMRYPKWTDIAIFDQMC